MSNFYCEHCGKPILEGKGGSYVTGCEHYPTEEREPEQRTYEQGGREKTVSSRCLIRLWERAVRRGEARRIR